MKKPKIVFVCNTTGSRLWRVNPIARYLLNTKKWDVRIMESKAYLHEAIDWADIAVLQMVFDKRIFERAKKNNTKIVFELDDLIHWVPDDHYAKDDMGLNRTFWVFWAIRNADAVTLTNDYLKKKYDKIRIGKDKCHIFPNYVDPEVWAFPPVKNASDKVRIGYCGGLSHVDDLKMIIRPFKKILKGDKVKLINVAAGGTTFDDPIKGAYYPVDVFKDLPQHKKEFIEGVNMNAWPGLLNSLALDIGLAPLLNNKFTQAKTPIKWMEYSINKISTVCSQFMYGKIVEDGVTGFLANSEEEWQEKTERLIKDKKLRQKMGETAYQEVLANHDVNKHLHEWYDLYSSLL